MIVAIIQARMGSSRLPGKIMLKTCGKTFLEHVIDRVIQSKTLDKVVVATSLNKNDDVIEDLCRKKNILYFRGSENDVLSRYKMAADKTHADVIIRLTSDTPLLHSTVIDKVVQTYINNDYDYVSNCFPLPRTYPDGVNVEVFSKKILDEMYNNAKKPSEREHVTLFMVFKPEIYKIYRVDYDRDISKYRFNLDYESDYKLLKIIFEKLYFKNSNFTMEDVIKLLEENPSIFQINAETKPYEGILKSFIEDETKGFAKSKNFFQK